MLSKCLFTRATNLVTYISYNYIMIVDIAYLFKVGKYWGIAIYKKKIWITVIFSSPNVTCTGPTPAPKRTAIWWSASCARTSWPHIPWGHSASGRCAWPAARRTASCLPKRPQPRLRGRCTSTTSRRGPTTACRSTLCHSSPSCGTRPRPTPLTPDRLWFIAGICYFYFHLIVGRQYYRTF